MKIVPIKMDEVEVQVFKEARARSVIDGKRVGTWLAEAIEFYLKEHPPENTLSD